MTTTFLRLLNVPVEDKPAALASAIESLRSGRKPTNTNISIFETPPSAISHIPGSPFAYWASDRVHSVFGSHPPLQHGERTAVIGASTKDDGRFLRLRWEITVGPDYRPFAKGGAYATFHSNIHLVLRWSAEGREAKTFVSDYREARGWSPHWKAELHNPDFYYRPGLTWPRRTQSGLGMRAMPAGCIFADKGPAVFVGCDDTIELLALLAVTTSSVFCYLVELQMAFGSYEVGVIQRTPVPELSPASRDVMAKLARRAWSLKYRLDTTNETSNAFVLPFGLNESTTGLDPADIGRELSAIQLAIDRYAFELYGIDEEDRESIRGVSSISIVGDSSDDADEAPDDPDSDEPAITEDRKYSWLVGIAFGRFDHRLATGERALPVEPEPFDPLPTRSPGMWPEGDLSLSVTPSIAVDDIGHRDDFATLIDEAAVRVGRPNPQDLRLWLAREFFAVHIKMYSKSRRKAPIYWQLATPSASYSVWLYIHAFNRDTLFRVQNDYVTSKLLHEERKLESLRKEHGANAGFSERRAITDQGVFVDELRGFLEEVRRVTPLWNPNLDDGVLLNFAPLWRLVPQNRGWQKELKTAWDALCNAEYDWSHLAMHLWPERVVLKCAIDRSLAIAHGLEAVFWTKGVDGKWNARVTATRSVSELVQERSSPAVKAALASLLDAPTATGGRGKRGRAAKTITADML